MHNIKMDRPIIRRLSAVALLLCILLMAAPVTGSAADSEEISCTTPQELWEEIQRAAENPDTEYAVQYSGKALILQFDTLIPANMEISFHCDGLGIAVITGTTLTVSGKLHLYQTQIDASGTLVNQGTIFVQDKTSGVVLNGGKYTGDGLICVRDVSDSYFPLKGINKAIFVEDKNDDGSVVYRLSEEFKPLSLKNGKYQALILDEIGLLSAEEQEMLLKEMEPITQYGSVAFWSTNEFARDEVEQARLKRRELFGLESGTILVINMNIRKVSIQSYGTIYDSVTVGQANTITNNVRNYLTRGQYYKGAKTAYGQINSLLRGKRIPQPMKYLSNAVIALAAGMILMLQFVFQHSSTYIKPTRDKIQYVSSGAVAAAAPAAARLLGVRKVHRPSSDSVDASGCSSCSSGGSSCSSCSSCGGGGSSSF